MFSFYFSINMFSNLFSYFNFSATFIQFANHSKTLFSTFNLAFVCFGEMLHFNVHVENGMMNYNALAALYNVRKTFEYVHLKYSLILLISFLS